MASSEAYLKWQYKVSKSRCLVTRLIGLGISCLRMQVLTIWMLLQRLGVANRTASPDLSQKVEPLLLSFTLNPDWRNYLVERKYICILDTQYTGYSFNTVTLVVPFSGSKISYSIRTVSKATINSSAFEFVVSTQL